MNGINTNDIYRKKEKGIQKNTKKIDTSFGFFYCWSVIKVIYDE